MLPIKKKLCPTDFSEPSYKGVDAANELSEHFSAELILLNVLNPMFPVGAPGVPPSHHVEEAYKELEQYATKSLIAIENNIISSNVKSKRLTVQGDAADQIVNRLFLYFEGYFKLSRYNFF